MRKLTALALASTLALGSFSFAYAADTTAAPAAPAQTQGKMMHHKGPMGNPFAGLNLTEQQRQQMRDIMKPRHSEEQRTQMMQHHSNLHALVTADSFDESKAKAEIDAISKAQNERMLERVRAENKMYNLLTPEQKTQFEQNYQKRTEKMGEHHRSRGMGQPAAGTAPTGQ